MDIPHPRRATFIKQANVAENQQINLAEAPSNNQTNSENILKSKNQVSGVGDLKALDSGAEETTIGADTLMATLDQGDGAKVPRG